MTKGIQDYIIGSCAKEPGSLWDLDFKSVPKPYGKTDKKQKEGGGANLWIYIEQINGCLVKSMSFRNNILGSEQVIFSA